MHLAVKPLHSQRMGEGFDVFESLLAALRENGERLESGDVIVISTKFVSNAQKRLISTGGVKASKQACGISDTFQIKPEVAEIILRESDEVFGGVAGFVITTIDGIMAPNAGIDRSNTRQGRVILYPKEPYAAAEEIRRKVFLRFHIHVGVILADSRLMPARVGTSGVAIACAGMEPVLDRRAERDLDGNLLKVTFQAMADNIATIANHEMGEGAESRPFAIVRHSGARLTDRRINPDETTVPSEQCVYVRGLAS